MLKSLTIAAAAAVALSGAALVTTSPASAAATAKNSGYSVQAKVLHHRKMPRVQATGVARGGVLIPYVLKKAKAQRDAISNWNAKVRRAYGAQYANWNRASAKSTSCTRVATAVSCRVSAIPSGPRYGMLN